MGSILSKDDRKCPCGCLLTRSEHICYYCHKKGFKHLDEDCPKKCHCNKDEFHTKSEHKCWFCNKKGHGYNDKHECPKYKKYKEKDNNSKCDICGKKEHRIHPSPQETIYLVCPDICCCGKRHTKKNHICKFCGEKGLNHLDENCSKKCLCGYYDDHSKENHKQMKYKEKEEKIERKNRKNIMFIDGIEEGHEEIDARNLKF